MTTATLPKTKSYKSGSTIGDAVRSVGEEITQPLQALSLEGLGLREGLETYARALLGLLLQPRVLAMHRLMVAEGLVQKSPEGVVHLMTSRVFDRTAELDRLSEADSLSPDPVRARHPRDVRILPKSRDFH